MSFYDAPALIQQVDQLSALSSLRPIMLIYEKLFRKMNSLKAYPVTLAADKQQFMSRVSPNAHRTNINQSSCQPDKNFLLPLNFYFQLSEMKNEIIKILPSNAHFVSHMNHFGFQTFQATSSGTSSEHNSG